MTSHWDPRTLCQEHKMIKRLWKMAWQFLVKANVHLDSNAASLFLGQYPGE